MSPSTDAARQRILLIDDDELISGSLRQYLVLLDRVCALHPQASVIVLTAYASGRARERRRAMPCHHLTP